MASVSPLGIDLDDLGLRTEYQPIVDLDTDTAVGYEALTRTRAGARFARPDQLLAAARDAGCLVEVDSHLRAIAFATASAAGLRAPNTLLVNCEPENAGRLALETAQVLMTHVSPEAGAEAG